MKENINIRTNKRFSHLCIGLNVSIQQDWRQIKALDWNETGFNFWLDRSIEETGICFKKGAEVFNGEVVWKHKNDDDSVILEMILNTMLFDQIKNKGDHIRESIRGIIKLIRMEGRIEEKLKLLSALGVNGFSYKEAERLIEDRKNEHPVYRYGVKLASEEWATVSRHMLEVSSSALLSYEIDIINACRDSEFLLQPIC